MKVQKIFRSPKNLLVAICFVVVFFPSTVFGFAPSDLSNLSLWLKADSLGLTDGASVSSWTDSSGNNHNATQVTTNAQPIFKTNILGGKPVIRFDGINDELSESLSVSNTNYTVFLVAKSTASAGSFHIAVGYGNGSDGTLWMGQFNSTNEITISGSSLANDLKTNADPAANHIYSVVANGGALYGYVDGSSAGVGGALGNRPSDYLTLGSYSNDGLPWQGDIAEVIVYNSSLSDSDRQQVENYLNTKYASNTAPVVTMTSPGQGNTVKGAVTLSATASDDVSVSGVQFKLDTNTLIGSEITSAPYTMSWNSTGVPNGGHTLSAVARDGSGAYATSTINITVKQSHGSSAARAIVTSSKYESFEEALKAEFEKKCRQNNIEVTINHF